ncbi:MAG: type II secretion system F family protein [Candidatus Riflebacteria bacterium]|nr:type II secretion system F family protein [Candidatus Riflebacteria bacterium]
MPKYKCEVRNAEGKVLTTTLEAPSMQELSNRLSSQGYYLIKAEAEKQGLSMFFSKSVPQKELLIFTVQLATLVGSAVSLVESVGILADQTQNKYFKSVLKSVERDLNSGQSFSSALRKFPDVFSRVYCNMCEAGEAGGMLDSVLNRLAAFSEADAEIRGRLKAALTMPVVQLVLAAGAVVFLLVKIFPNFAKMFAKMKADLPKITELMMLASDTLIEHYIIVTVVFVGGGTLLYLFTRTTSGKRLIATIKLRAPVLGEFTQKVAVSRFARTFSSLLGAGVHVTEALKITGSVMDNPILEELMDDMSIGVQQGKTLYSTLENSSVFPPMIKKMVQVGEGSGNLEPMLNKAADFYDREVKDSIEAMTSALTPILTVIMGIIIGVIALSVFVPIFKMSQSIK